MKTSTNIIKEVVNFKDRVEISEDSLRFMKRTMTINKTGGDNPIADKILDQMQKDKDVTWVVYYGKYTNAT